MGRCRRSGSCGNGGHRVPTSDSLPVLRPVQENGLGALCEAMGTRLRQFENTELRGDRRPYKEAFVLLQAVCERKRVPVGRMALIQNNEGYCGFVCGVGQKGERVEITWRLVDGDWCLQFGAITSREQIRTLGRLEF